MSWVNESQSEYFERLANETYKLAWKQTMKDMRNIFRKNKIKRIFDGSN